MNNASKIKKLLLVLIAAVLIIVLLQWLWHYKHTGKIVITTNQPSNSITLTEVNSSNLGGANSPSFKSKGKLSATVGVGTYLASVSGNSNMATQLITLNSNVTLSYEIDLKNTANTEPVLFANAQDLLASGNQLLYLDTTNYLLQKIDANNNLTEPVPAQQLRTIKWINPSLGIGQDINQIMYVVSNEVATPLSVPYPSNRGSLNYGVASNGQIYVASGADVYLGNQNGGFKKIYTAQASNLVIGAAPGKAAVAYSTGNTDSSNWLAVVSQTGSAIKTSAGEGISDLIWSPDGQYLATTNESSITVYNSSLHLIAVIPTTSLAGSLIWSGSNKVYYTTGSNLWSYSISQQRQDLLSRMPLNYSVTGLAVNDDQSYIYVGTTDSASASSSEILSVPLRKQQVSTALYQLQDILPMALNDCTISFANFGQPTAILVEPNPDSGLSAAAYIQEAQSELQQDGFNINGFQYKLVQPS